MESLALDLFEEMFRRLILYVPNYFIELFDKIIEKTMEGKNLKDNEAKEFFKKIFGIVMSNYNEDSFYLFEKIMLKYITEEDINDTIKKYYQVC